MDNNITIINQKVIAVTLGINILFFILNIFKVSKSIAIAEILTNVLLLGTYFLIKKNENIIEMLLYSNSMAKKLNGVLGGLNGEVSK